MTEENKLTAAKVSKEPGSGFLDHSPQLVELLTNMSSVLELLSEAALSSLEEQERQVKLS